MFKRADIILVGLILVIALSFLVFTKITEQSDYLVANIYHRDVLVMTIDLSTLDEEPIEFIVSGDNGDIIVLAKHNGIKVYDVDCREEICKAHDWVDSTSKMIVCLPNRISIRLISNGPQDGPDFEM